MIKFFEHFVLVAQTRWKAWRFTTSRTACTTTVSVFPDGTDVPVKVHSMVADNRRCSRLGIVDQDVLNRAQTLGKGFSEHVDLDQKASEGMFRRQPGEQRLLLGVVGIERLRRLIARLVDEGEFLSAHGLRAVSAYHREHPYTLDVEGLQATIDYEPAESTTTMFGGNSNWRGPIWYPLNHLVCDALERYGRFLGEDEQLDFPTGSGKRLPLTAIASELRRRNVSLFLVDGDGRRAVLRPLRKDAGRPAMEGQHPVQRVLSRRHWPGIGCHPPDRVDRAGCAPDPAHLQP